jgi:dihydroxyacetone kinase
LSDEKRLFNSGSRRGSGGSNASTPKSPKEKKIADGEGGDANHHPVGTVTVEMTPPAQVNQKQEV